jgi:adenine/guanine phosphoribosyltransferase-like PRPP-binding protein
MTELDKTNLVRDLSLLKFAAGDALMTFVDKSITQVLPTGIDGIPLATLIAETMGADVVVPTQMRRRGVEYYEVKYGEDYVRTFYVPRKMLPKRSSVLLVNDVIRYGYREKSLIDLTYRIGGEVRGGYFLIAKGNEWEKRVKIPDIRVVVRLPYQS